VAHQTRSIEQLDVHVLQLPTERPESDGTARWSATTMVLAELRAAGLVGLGYSYITAAAGSVIRDLLAPCVVGADAFAIPDIVTRMVQAVRNHGRPGLVACAISAVDVALWDLKAKLLDVALAMLLGPARSHVPAYASGGFTSSGLDELAREVEGYVAHGYRRVKIKIGREPEQDPDRIRVLAQAAGPHVETMVDANGAYHRKQALAMADTAARHGVVYFEEPVSSDDLEGLHVLRHRAPMSIAAGEYGYDAVYFRRMLEAGAVDILQADATRCLGVTGFLHADALCEAYATPLSAHCAPAIHAHAGAAARRLVHVEHFRDHVRMESILFDGVPALDNGALVPDLQRPGLGLLLKPAEAKRYAA
jgi:L-alanine-DL-glutamate epimerase-like enolase superfamily enzyme